MLDGIVNQQDLCILTVTLYRTGNLWTGSNVSFNRYVCLHATGTQPDSECIAQTSEKTQKINSQNIIKMSYSIKC